MGEQYQGKSKRFEWCALVATEDIQNGRVDCCSR